MIMGAFIHTAIVPAPTGRTIMVKSGGSVFFAALTRFSGWQMLSGGRQESVPPPQLWWQDEAVAEGRPLQAPATQQPSPPCQVQLCLAI